MNRERKTYASMIIVALLFGAFAIFLFLEGPSTLPILILICAAVLCSIGLWGSLRNRKK
ncbi:hypothetical protein SAMN04489740_4056 [Arthrobacter alpinus]|uniref:Uncharacterized protein n=1 Tax=Arthrobacter alpinus TaxID=656366 RepID=A0A1H5PAS3_9MICC|nr:hypothetical protein SAMN04489740_4056 [Arthrobacter alpinus]